MGQEPRLEGFRLPCLRVLRVEDEVVVVVCDRGLLGKEYKQGELRLKVDKSFYNGRNASVEECLEALQQATIANLVGSIVKHAIERGIIAKENVLNIGGVLHAQLVKLR